MKDFNKDTVKGTNMYGNTAHNIYAQNNVGIESPAKLVEMMYEGILRFNAQAKKAVRDGDVEKRVYWTNRSIAIITELVSTVDMSQGDVSSYLSGLYNYEIQLLSSVGVGDGEDKLNEVSNVFKGLLEAWREVSDVAN